jgi:hypothetical protein
MIKLVLNKIMGAIMIVAWPYVGGDGLANSWMVETNKVSPSIHL